MFRIFINVVFQFYAIYCGYVNENCLAIAVTEKTSPGYLRRLGQMRQIKQFFKDRKVLNLYGRAE